MKVYQVDWVNWKGTKMDVKFKLETNESKDDVLRLVDEFTKIMQNMVEEDLYTEEDPIVS